MKDKSGEDGVEGGPGIDNLMALASLRKSSALFGLGRFIFQFDAQDELIFAHLFACFTIVAANTDKWKSNHHKFLTSHPD